MKIQKDGLGQPYIEWSQGDVPWGFKKAWIQRLKFTGTRSAR
jgi:hypothetical protein